MVCNKTAFNRVRLMLRSIPALPLFCIALKSNRRFFSSRAILTSGEGSIIADRVAARAGIPGDKLFGDDVRKAEHGPRAKACYVPGSDVR